MKLGAIEKGVISTATKKLKEYLKGEGGKKSFSITAVNKWLSENGFSFSLTYLVEDEEEKLEIKVLD
jgi:hypothetical protein